MPGHYFFSGIGTQAVSVSKVSFALHLKINSFLKGIMFNLNSYNTAEVQKFSSQSRFLLFSAVMLLQMSGSIVHDIINL